MKYIKTFLTLSFIFSFVNCMGNYTSSIHSPLVFANTSQNINEHYTTGDNSPRIGNAKIVKKGQACFKGLPVINQYIFDSEDATIEAAMKDGGITKLAIVDRKSFYLFPILTLYAKECIIVYGE